MSTTRPSGKNQRYRSSSVRHSKEDALSEREFEELVAATYRLDDYWSLQCRFVVFLAGRLGMRAGEIAHMTEEWIDWRRNMICIPRHEPCDSGRDGGLCCYCRQHAKQKVEHNDELSLDAALDSMWSAKTDSAAREIPFDADTRSTIVLEEFFDRFDEYPNAQQSINRRVSRAAREARGLDADDVFPHALRATAASHFVASGLDVFALKSLLGWANLQTAKVYISNSGERTAQAIRDSQF